VGFVSALDELERTGALGQDYSLRLYRAAPENRRFQRWILRRRSRLLLIFEGIPTAFHYDRGIHTGSSLSITAEDRLSWLQRMRQR
jgi:hypothetical protein